MPTFLRTLIQPTNAWWWFAIIAVALVPLAPTATGYLPIKVLSPAAIATVASLASALAALALWRLSRTAACPKPGWPLLGLGFLWGFVVAPTIAPMFGNGIQGLTKLTGSPLFETAFGTSIPEETVKLLGVLVLFNLARPAITRPAHCVVLGFAVGLGFMTFEDVNGAATYAIDRLGGDIDGVAIGWIQHTLLGLLHQGVWTAIGAWGLGQFIFTKRRASLLWIGVPFVLHFLYAVNWPLDGVMPAPLASASATGITVVVAVVSLAILTWLWRGHAPKVEATNADQIAQYNAHHQEVAKPIHIPNIGPLPAKNQFVQFGTAMVAFVAPLLGLAAIGQTATATIPSLDLPSTTSFEIPGPTKRLKITTPFACQVLPGGPDQVQAATCGHEGRIYLINVVRVDDLSDPKNLVRRGVRELTQNREARTLSVTTTQSSQGKVTRAAGTSFAGNAEAVVLQPKGDHGGYLIQVFGASFLPVGLPAHPDAKVDPETGDAIPPEQPLVKQATDSIVNHLEVKDAATQGKSTAVQPQDDTTVARTPIHASAGVARKES